MFISELSHDCEQALTDACTDALSKTQIYDELEDTHAAARDHWSASRGQLLTTIKTQQGRFRVWARNMGALHDPTLPSSLDSRLHDDAKVQKAITSILEGLLASLSRARKILRGDLPNRTAAIEATDEGVSQGIKTELSELILSVGCLITDLCRYSVFLRQPQPHRKAPLGGELPSRHLRHDVAHTKDKFQKLQGKPWLADRLGNAISRRRGYIRFRQRHHEPMLKPQPQLEANAKEKETVSAKAATDNEAEDDSAASLSKVRDDSRQSTRTTVTPFVTVYNNDGTAEVRVPDLERLKFGNIWLKYDEFIECPFCRTIQKLHNNSEWRHHVFTDLQPYVCTFEGCSSGTFKARHDWFRHEMDCHRREWHCLQCHNVFGSQSELGFHFKTDHTGDIAESQIGQLLNMCGRPTRHFGYGSCPLCDTWQPARDQGDNSRDFCKHLAHHLEQLALSSTPLIINNLEIAGGDVYERIQDDDADEEIESDQLTALSESDFTGFEESCIFWLYEPSRYSSSQRNACRSPKVEISHGITHAVDHHGLVRGRDANHPNRTYITSCKRHNPIVKSTGTCYKCKAVSRWADADFMDPLHAGPALCLRCWCSFDKRGLKEHLDQSLCSYNAEQPKTRKILVLYTTFCSQYRPPNHIPPNEEAPRRRAAHYNHRLRSRTLASLSNENPLTGTQQKPRPGSAQGPTKPTP